MSDAWDSDIPPDELPDTSLDGLRRRLKLQRRVGRRPGPQLPMIDNAFGLDEKDVTNMFERVDATQRRMQRRALVIGLTVLGAVVASVIAILVTVKVLFF